MSERRFHLGIDYGTSTSKLVLRDYGSPEGDRAFILSSSNGFRIPSGVTFADNHFVLSHASPERADQTRFESVKMRVAEEASNGRQHFHYGPKPKFPEGITARDIAVLTVWWLISIGHRVAHDRLANTGGRDLVMGMTMGVPMSFYDDKRIRGSFLQIARTAWRLYRREGLLPDRVTIQPQSLTKLINNHLDNHLPTNSEDIRDWIRSETEAGMWWAFQSPSVSDGPFAQIDVGAGTTNVSLFRIYTSEVNRRRVKDGLAFFASCSEPAGMDAVDELISQSILDVSLPFRLRGSEDSVIRQAGLEKGVAALVRDKIWEAYRRAWIRSCQKINQCTAELTAWRNHRVILIGGGTVVTSVRRQLPLHPRDNGHSLLELQHLEVPTDLFFAVPGKKASFLRMALNKLGGGSQYSAQQLHRPVMTDLPFLAVAYGLSNIGVAIPEVVTPTDLPAMRPPANRRQRLNHDDIYAK